jgi:uncharacterized protein YebE (UPF0316 family)
MVKINISIEGEDISEIIDELFTIGLSVVKSNRNHIQEIMKICADEAFEVLMDRKTIEKGALLYKKLNTEINWTYKKDKQ